MDHFFWRWAPQKIDEGQSPCISAQHKVAFARAGQMYVSDLPAAGREKPVQIVVRGKNEPREWSPDGTKLLFVSDRRDHSFIGIFDLAANSMKFLAPSVDNDGDPVWSADGSHVAFVPTPAVPRDPRKDILCSQTALSHGQFGSLTL